MTLTPDLTGCRTLADVARRRASLSPERLAYRFLADGETEEATLTYAGLDRRARALAARLFEVGAKPGDRALLLYPAGVDYVAAFFGCLYAGVVAVPAYPPRPNRPMPRIRAIVADATATVALTTAGVLATLKRRIEDMPDLKALAWLASDSLPEEAFDGTRAHRVEPGDLAFLQYTSGSTSTPKGVMVSHANLVHNEELIRRACTHGPDTPFVSWLPLYHDMGLIGCMIQALHVGTPCTLMSPVAFLQRPRRWLAAISRYGAHTSGAPNFAYELCLEKIPAEERQGLDLSSWRVAFNGAEPVRAETLHRFQEAFAPYGLRPDALFPCYGMAETTLIVSGGDRESLPVTRSFAAEPLTRDRAEPAEEGAERRELAGSGRVLPGMEVAIVAPDTGAALTDGRVGEIWVAGGSVAAGYWNRPEATAASFGATTADGRGPYLRTGDLGFLHEGELYVTGRLKDLIIVRGANHYPQDVELSAERSHEALRPGASAAFSVEVDGSERLVLVAEVERERRKTDPQEIAAAVRRALAEEHELALHALVLLRPGSLPKTTSGKIQRRQCRADYLAGALAEVGKWQAETGESAPADGAHAADIAGMAGMGPTDAAHWLASRLAARAGVAPRDIDASLPVSHWGLDSLAAIELMHEIEARTGAALPLEGFFGSMTLAEMAARITAAAATEEPLDEAPAALAGPAAYPLSAGQRALWLLHRLDPESPAYSIASAARIEATDGPLDVAALAAAFQALVDRHPALRTAFVLEDGEPVQRVAGEATIDFLEEDAGDSGESELLSRLLAEATRPFALERGRLLRARLYTRGAGVAILLVAAHHIVTDFWSLAVMVRELGILYAASRVRRPAALAPSATYADFVAHERALLTGPEGEGLFAWWLERLAGAPQVLELPTDRPRPPVQTLAGDAIRLRLPAPLTAAIQAFARQHATSPFAVLLAAWSTWLGRAAGQDDLLVGAPAAGRTRAQWADLVGYFVNPLPLRASLGDRPSFTDLASRTRSAVLGAFDHQDLPFPALVERLHPQRDPSRSPLFQVMFAWQSAPAREDAGLAAFAVGEEGAEVQTGPLRLRHLPLTLPIAQFDLTLSAGLTAGEIATTLDFNTDLYDRATVERFLASWAVLLEAGIATPERSTADLPLVTAAERAQLLQGLNATAAPLLPTTVAELIAAQALSTPDLPAVRYQGEIATYRQLLDRASAIAGELESRGARPEEPIALLLPRSLDLPAAMIGVLQAGAAFLPLDPEAPAEHNAAKLTDGNVRLVLIDSRNGTPVLPKWVEVIDLNRHREREGAGVSLAGAAKASAPPLTLHANPTTRPLSGTAEGDPRARRAALPDEGAATLIYTSGSTGRPKGVILTHRNLTNLVLSFTDAYAPGPGDAILPLTAVAFASFVGEVLPLLAAGGTVVLPEETDLLDPTRTLHLIETAKVTIISSVPALLAGLNRQADRLPHLRLILAGGEALTANDVDRLLGRTQVVNGYGLTETAICSTIHPVSAEDLATPAAIPVGKPVRNHRVYVLGPDLEPRPAGLSGDLYLAGAGLARGYANDPAATALRFLPDPFHSGERMYRTGDIARVRADGNLEYLGRADRQVKVRGFRIELGEIEAAFAAHPAALECAVTAWEEGGETTLAAYVVASPGTRLQPAGWTAWLRERLPSYMVPASVTLLPALPRTATGKVDRKALPRPEKGSADTAAHVLPRGQVERAVAAVWAEILGVPQVGQNDNFFDLGGHSLLMAKLHARLAEAVPSKRELTLIDLFKAPTVAAQARLLAPEGEVERPAHGSFAPAIFAAPGGRDIAVIAIAGRFPGAKNTDEFWANLTAGVESITRFTDEELLAAGVPPELVENPNYIKAKGILGGVELFDAAFFGFSPRGAELTDPQHRVFLECAWEAFELAGYDPGRYPGRVGVFAGQSMNTYWLNNLYHHIDLVASVDSLQAAIGNDKDSLTTEVSYRLNLRGPSVLVQSSSSTSLTAIHYACQSLLAGECEMALAGGSSIHVPEVSGYLYHEGGTTDPEGHCRAFSADAKGFVSGHGAGAVILKPLAAALADGDTVLAVVKGSACNNDGSAKVSYMAPSVDGHAEVVAMAQAAAGVSPDTITYVEAHGTGTLLGDPIEVAALTQAFRIGTERKGYCALGSAKTHIGHLDTAAGVAGLIKAVLALRHRTLPGILHFIGPNPKIDFAGSPFYINQHLEPWDVPEGLPRRAGVSSLGMGGTNTHVVLEEVPELAPTTPSRPWQLLTLSARTESALETLTDGFARALAAPNAPPFADAAYTMHVGRRPFGHRCTGVFAEAAEAATALSERDAERLTGGFAGAERGVAFLFSGQGAQYPDMGRGLYETEEVFRREIDRAAEILLPHLGLDLRALLYPEDGGEGLTDTAFAQPALFAVEHALARLWESWGVRPQAMLGHSIGEYTAACLAGVFSFEDALALVALRGRLMNGMPAGAMLAVSLSESEIAPYLGAGVELAAVNRPDLCVLSGPFEAIEAVTATLGAQGFEARRLHTSHAFHSAMMEPVLDEFAAAVARVPRRPPQIPFVSNLSGTWIRPEEAMDPAYWARQLRGAVRFSDGVATLLGQGDLALLEVGPGNALATAARQHPAREGRPVIASMRHPKEEQADLAVALSALGKLWVAGVVVDWEGFHAGERRRRVALPTYPFERKRFWVDPKKPEVPARPKRATDPADFFHAPAWRRAVRAGVDLVAGARASSWVVVPGEGKLAERLAERLGELGAEVLVGESTGEGTAVKVVDLSALWLGRQTPSARKEEAAVASLNALCERVRRLGEWSGGADLAVVTAGVFDVIGGESCNPHGALLTGPVQVAPREYLALSARLVDLPSADLDEDGIDALIAELCRPFNPEDALVAFRGGHRWLPSFEPLRLTAAEPLPFRRGGVYLFTGGLGGMALAVAEHLARVYSARLVLLGRSALPAEGAGTVDARKARRLAAVRRLEELGAEVMVEAADVASETDMARVREAVAARFGAVDGIFHLAGVPGGSLLAVRTTESARAVLAPKVAGTRVLAAAFPEPFLILFSSVTAVLGQLGQTDYAAANAFLDAFAVSSSGRRVVSLDWDAWREVGMAVETEVPEALRAFRDESLAAGFTSAEGVEALLKALASGLPRLALSKLDLERARLTSLASKPLAELAAGESADDGERAVHARPQIAATFVPPKTPMEEQVAAVWQQILGIDRVGVADNFFELGGNSLVGLKVISRLKAETGADLAAVALFEAPTVAALARLLERQAGTGVGAAAQEPGYQDRKSRGALRRERLLQRRK